MALQRAVNPAAEAVAPPVPEAVAPPAAEAVAPPVPEAVAPPVQEEVAPPVTVSTPVPEVALVPTQGTGLAVTDGNKNLGGKALAELKDACIVDFGTLDRLKSGQGIIVDQDGSSLGRHVDLQVVSYNSHWTISPNDDVAPDDIVKFSLDNKVIDGSPDLTVGECLASMKEEWPKASVKEYYEVVGMLLSSEEKSNLLHKVVQIQLSPTSRQSFTNYQIQIPFQKIMGLPGPDDPTKIRFTATNKSGTGKNWTQLASSAMPV